MRTLPNARAGLLALALLLLAACGDPVFERDQPLPALPIAGLDGRTLPASHFEGRPWVINVWMPG